MKKLTLTSQKLNNLNVAVDALNPQECVNALGGDPIEASRSVQKIADKMAEANKEFLDVVKASFDANEKAYEKAKADMDAVDAEEGDASSKEAKKGKIWAEYREFAEKTQRESKANELKDNSVTVSLSDEEQENLLKLLPATLKTWVGPKGESCRHLMLECYDAVKDAAAC